MTSHLTRVVFVGLALMAGLALTAGAQALPINEPHTPPNLWQTVTEEALVSTGERLIIPDRYRVVTLDVVQLQVFLARAPLENTDAARADQTILSLPLPDGSYGRFRIVESPIMEPGLAAKFPELKTYLGQGVDDPTAVTRFDQTPAGFHAMIRSSAGTIFIDPYQRGDTQHYIVYDKRDYRDPEAGQWSCGFAQENPSTAGLDLDHLNLPRAASGPVLRTYRLAMAATGEYTTFHGGTVSAGLAAIVTSMNRVNLVYEQEVAVRMVLIANNNLLVYTDGATDPYTNNNGSTMLGQNQTNLDSVIGTAKYDIGHVFSTGGGGVAYLNAPCNSSTKARGVTGRSQPVGDPFDIDYVAHEIGHQFGANHTFNGTTSSCGGGNRSASAAYEPGSGSTIMAYAGICGAENLQLNSDPYFHTKSFDEIIAFTTTGNGNTCAVATNTGNNAPTVNAGQTYTIPMQTPFALTGSASDPDGDALTHDWEQFDRGTAAPPNTDDGTRPIFRVFNPTTSGTRIFPKLSDILNNTSTFGEALPTTTRSLTFRLTARDNKAGGGGVNYATVVLKVSNQAGPFAITSANTPYTWTALSTYTVTWNVANTNAAPVNCPNVDLLLSDDGGATFPVMLAAATPNDGSQAITLPLATTTQARLKVQCSTNIFFDISNVNGTILPAPNDVPISGLVATNDSPTPLHNPTSLTATIAAGTNVAYVWDFGDGTPYGNTAAVLHTYSSVGLYTAVVTASNNLNSLSTATQVTITDVPIDGLTALNNSPLILGDTTVFTATIDAGTNVAYVWNFGDGTPLDSQAYVTHTYTSAGTFTATVTATNLTNARAASTRVIILPHYHCYLPLIWR